MGEKKKGKKRNSAFWKKIRFKYRISIINENTLEEIWRIRTSLFSGGSTFILMGLALVAITSIVIIATPIRYYLPGYMDEEIRGKAILSTVRVDSLEEALLYHNAYINSLEEFLSGKTSVDSIIPLDSISVSTEHLLLQKSEAEKKFIQKYEEDERYNLNLITSDAKPTSDIFTKPMNGVITKHYNSSEKQYSLQVQANSAETVLATLDGVVIFTTYDIINDYTIQIQHTNNYVSVYKGCTQIVKKIGDKVKTGEAIAYIKPEEEHQTLSYELWSKGEALDPEIFIPY